MPGTHMPANTFVDLMLRYDGTNASTLYAEMGERGTFHSGMSCTLCPLRCARFLHLLNVCL
eukprot:SAG31_NODE_322_length_17726_cov_18.070006_13_plen_61_part_00